VRKKFFFLLFPVVIIPIILFGHHLLPADIYLETEKSVHLHYDFVDIYAQIRNRHLRESFKNKILYGLVYKGGGKSPIPTIGKRWSVRLEYSKKNGRWQGRWPVPWNATDGEYLIRIWLSPEMRRIRLNECKFFISRRKPAKLTPGLCVMTMENMRPLETIRVKGPDGEIGGWRKLLDWVQFSGANTFWYMAGQTSAYDKRLPDDFPWNTENLDFIDDLAREAEKRKIDFGYWIQCYLTFGPPKFRVNYEYGWDYKNNLGGAILTRGISTRDGKRKDDIVKFIRRLNSIEEVDYIGFDYIRAAGGGLELVDEFVEEMEVEVPEKWEKFSQKERMDWLGKIVERTKERDIPIIDQWNWWRARQVALILKRIKEDSGITKPLWVFNLGWEKGWQHGQDAVMMNDAGSDIIAIMLYESDYTQLDCFVEEWHNYLKKGDANLIVGDDYDWPLHQYTINPAGPEDFYGRTLKAMDNIYGDGPVSGIFTHDLARALWGRKGAYPSKEWILAGASCFTSLRERLKLIPIHTEIEVPEKVFFDREFSVSVAVKNNNSSPLNGIKVSIMPQTGFKVVSQDFGEIESLSPGETDRVEFRLRIDELHPERGFRHMVASKIDSKSFTFPSYAFKYVNLIIKEPLISPTTASVTIE